MRRASAKLLPDPPVTSLIFVYFSLIRIEPDNVSRRLDQVKGGFSKRERGVVQVPPALAIISTVACAVGALPAVCALLQRRIQPPSHVVLPAPPIIVIIRVLEVEHQPEPLSEGAIHELVQEALRCASSTEP
jgi:hypothetical protein